MSGEGSAEREGDGSWWAGPSSPFVLVRAGVASSLLSVVRPLLSFVRCRSFVLRRGRLASLVWGEVQWTALAVHCHWEVDGGRVALARRVAMEEMGYLPIY